MAKTHLALLVLMLVLVAAGLGHSFTLLTSNGATVAQRRGSTQLCSSSTREVHGSQPATTASPSSATAPIATAVSRNLSPLQSRCLLVTCAMIYGYGYVNTKGLQQTLAPSIVTMLRFMIASLIFLPSIVGNWRQSGEAAVRGGIELGVLCAAGFIAQGISLQTTSASKVAFFCGLSVIMPPLFTMIARRGSVPPPPPPVFQDSRRNNMANSNSSKGRWQRLASSPLIPPGLALCGAAILEWGSLDAPHIGDLFLLITPVSFAMCFWRAEKLSRRVPAGATAFVTGLMLSTCALISALFAVMTGAFPLSWASVSALASKLGTRQSVLSLIYTGGLATALTSYIEQRAIKVLSAADTTLIYSLEPIFATIFAAIFLHEPFSTGSIISAAFIITACLYDEMARRFFRKGKS